MYFGRVARIFEDAEVSRPDVERMKGLVGSGEGGEGEREVEMELEREMEEYDWNYSVGSPRSGGGHERVDTERDRRRSGDSGRGREGRRDRDRDWDVNDGAVGGVAVSPALVTFKRSWEGFVDSLIKEWNTFNLVSALLLSCVSSLFFPSFPSPALPQRD